MINKKLPFKLDTLTNTHIIHADRRMYNGPVQATTVQNKLKPEIPKSKWLTVKNKTKLEILKSK